MPFAKPQEQNPPQRKKWVKPRVSILEAGSAELNVGRDDDNLDFS